MISGLNFRSHDFQPCQSVEIWRNGIFPAALLADVVTPLFTGDESQRQDQRLLLGHRHPHVPATSVALRPSTPGFFVDDLIGQRLGAGGMLQLDSRSWWQRRRWRRRSIGEAEASSGGRATDVKCEQCCLRVGGGYFAVVAATGALISCQAWGVAGPGEARGGEGWGMQILIHEFPRHTFELPRSPNRTVGPPASYAGVRGNPSGLGRVKLPPRMIAYPFAHMLIATMFAVCRCIRPPTEPRGAAQDPRRCPPPSPPSPPAHAHVLTALCLHLPRRSLRRCRAAIPPFHPLRLPGRRLPPPPTSPPLPPAPPPPSPPLPPPLPPFRRPRRVPPAVAPAAKAAAEPHGRRATAVGAAPALFRAPTRTATPARAAVAPRAARTPAPEPADEGTPGAG